MVNNINTFYLDAPSLKILANLKLGEGKTGLSLLEDLAKDKQFSVIIPSVVADFQLRKSLRNETGQLKTMGGVNTVNVAIADFLKNLAHHEVEEVGNKNFDKPIIVSTTSDKRLFDVSNQNPVERAYALQETETKKIEKAGSFTGSQDTPIRGLTELATDFVGQGYGQENFSHAFAQEIQQNRNKINPLFIVNTQALLTDNHNKTGPEVISLENFLEQAKQFGFLSAEVSLENTGLQKDLRNKTNDHGAESLNVQSQRNLYDGLSKADHALPLFHKELSYYIKLSGQGCKRLADVAKKINRTLDEETISAFANGEKIASHKQMKDLSRALNLKEKEKDHFKTSFNNLKEYYQNEVIRLRKELKNILQESIIKQTEVVGATSLTQSQVSMMIGNADVVNIDTLSMGDKRRAKVKGELKSLVKEDQCELFEETFDSFMRAAGLFQQAQRKTNVAEIIRS